MVVNDYHIQNVLQAYRRQINRPGSQTSYKRDDPFEQADRISISTEAKRKQVISKTASEVIERITHKPDGSDFESEIVQRLSQEYGKPPNDQDGTIGTSITFKVVDEADAGVVKFIDSKDSGWLRKSLFDITELSKNNMA